MNDATAYEQVTREKVDAMEKRFEEHQVEINGNLDRIWRLLDKIRDRPPTWVSVVMTGGGAIIGALLVRSLGG